MRFSEMMHELRSLIEERKDLLLSIKDRFRLYNELNSIAQIISKKYGLVLQLNFPYPDKLYDYESYGRENISIVIDKNKRRFPMDREYIKKKAQEIFNDVIVKDAYMYEGREGVKVYFNEGRIDILPGSLHIWKRIDKKVEEFCDWLMDNCYKI